MSICRRCKNGAHFLCHIKGCMCPCRVTIASDPKPQKQGGCPGPVIATPKKCECGNVKPHKGHWWYSGFEPGGGPIVTCAGIATEPETPSYIPNLSKQTESRDNMSDDIVERLRDYAKSYRGGFGTTGNLLFEAADRIERLEAELAEANDVAQALEDSAQEVRVKLAEANAKIEAARESDRIDLLLALGIESAPKPTDNSESAT